MFNYFQIAVNEIREKFFEEQDSRERLIIKMTAEIEDKDREINCLLQQKSTRLPKSAQQELEEAEKLDKMSNLHQSSSERRLKSYRKHKAKCHLTLKKLNEKIKAGLLVDEDCSFSSCSSGDDSSCENVQKTIIFPSVSSSDKPLDDISCENNVCDILLDNRIKEKLSDEEEKMKTLKDDNESSSLRVQECEAVEDEPNVDNKSTEELASSESSHDESMSKKEEVIDHIFITQSLIAIFYQFFTGNSLIKCSALCDETVLLRCNIIL